MVTQRPLVIDIGAGILREEGFMSFLVDGIGDHSVRFLPLFATSVRRKLYLLNISSQGGTGCALHQDWPRRSADR
jgi:hypothetical protein